MTTLGDAMFDLIASDFTYLRWLGDRMDLIYIVFLGAIRQSEGT